MHFIITHLIGQQCQYQLEGEDAGTVYSILIIIKCSSVNTILEESVLTLFSLVAHISFIIIHIGKSGQRCSRSPLGGRLATTLVDRYFHHYFLFFSFFFFFPPSSTFLIEGVLGSKNLFSESGSKWPIT